MPLVKIEKITMLRFVTPSPYVKKNNSSLLNQFFNRLSRPARLSMEASIYKVDFPIGLIAIFMNVVAPDPRSMVKSLLMA